MSDNMNDKNENIDETVVDETAEAEASETVDDTAIGDIADDASSADSIESIDFTVMYDDDNADIEIAANDDAATSDDANDGDTARLQATILQMPTKPPTLQMTLRIPRMTIRTWWRITRIK